MFQYATARALAIRKSSTLLMDISDFESYELHQGFELNRVFGVPVGIAADVDVKNILGFYANTRIRKFMAKSQLKNFRPNNLRVEPCFSYWPDINLSPSDSYLIGYWQSERYFSSEADQIRDDFRFIQQVSGINSNLIKKIKAVNSISLHVRRGDYVSNKNALTVHGLCSIEYYQSAMRYIRERVEDPSVFIFSDDIDWVRDNIDFEDEHCFVGNNVHENSFFDMQLMSLCKHNIIANSSFSWWGAWLNGSPDKIVVSPKNWFKTNGYDTTDLYPSDWIRL